MKPTIITSIILLLVARFIIFPFAVFTIEDNQTEKLNKHFAQGVSGQVVATTNKGKKVTIEVVEGTNRFYGAKSFINGKRSNAYTQSSRCPHEALAKAIKVVRESSNVN